MPLLRGRASVGREFIVWHYPHYHGSAWTPGSAIRAGRWKLIEFYDKEKIELYDLESDLGERHDLTKTMPERARELRRKLRAYLESVNARMPTPRAEATPAAGEK